MEQNFVASLIIDHAKIYVLLIVNFKIFHAFNLIIKGNS